MFVRQTFTRVKPRAKPVLENENEWKENGRKNRTDGLDGKLGRTQDREDLFKSRDPREELGKQKTLRAKFEIRVRFGSNTQSRHHAHTQELTTEEIQELQSQQHTEVMQVIGFEESEEEVISTSEIKEILGMWERVSQFVEKKHPEKVATGRASDLFNDTCLTHFRNILRGRKKQTSLDMEEEEEGGMHNWDMQIVIDGWGVSDIEDGNAILHAKTPVMDRLAKIEGGYLTLEASSSYVGLPEGLMGNSEVGHLNIGAGRVLYQDIVRINMDVKSKAIHDNENFVDACQHAKSKNGRLHLMGLISDGGVHAHIDHLFSLLEGAKKQGVPNTYIQFFSDGRDTSPTSGITFVKQVLDKTKELQYGSLATITGRYYAMDRDKRWERVKIAYEGMVQGIGEKTTEAEVLDLIQKRYNLPDGERQTDEFLKPIIINQDGTIQDNDTLIFIDFRADRMRQISETFGLNVNFETDKKPKDIKLYTMTQYKKEFPFTCLYPPTVPKNVLAEWISTKSLSQFHCAETEKYAHVTFFFNGGQEQAFPLEERCMIPSPKVATYDLKPEMSCIEVGEKMAEVIQKGTYPFVMCNFAPPDMVGHTGVYDAAVLGVEATDKAIGIIADACEKNGYTLLITADHGNAEKMKDDKGGPHTAHTCNRVPFCMMGCRKFLTPGHTPALCDVAPTVLHLMGLDQPPEMTGKSLLHP
ncbi:hypothetical protein LAZ67_1004547 [Cordylochernes scorpioides]|uniref:phosphoglycerate mutase (2,3-diphosphoglycerate-independent) n=1 Tax=Cordylochernes scorpioides TaxID=51811 RepID=A0ABY6JZ05_9ARAC|nr:hypothetical protein LAZ67_1004547 [Cordylochernes scorpioides]